MEVRGIIDTGSSSTAVAMWVFEKLGLSPIAETTIETANGPVKVRIFSVSVAIRNPLGNGIPDFTLSTVFVHDIPAKLADADVLIGLNVLLECNFSLEGPARRFALEF